ncbi:hypothetical protein PVAND_007771 [Polypedilum vanderplanki]|uniref:Uncharacterized protein n=1 Tax=Polypedilum vanderplanki TaxID=319348 RepID=A0A9J6C800_POLVA|nr:hypothetical protein PVAND_007771 [Polypedilum vanderplanki]
MSKAVNNEDLCYEKQIEETNKYGNALLAELIAEKIADHKRKLSGRIQIKEEVKIYKKEIDKLRSLKIGNVHNILNVKEENDPSIQIEAANKLILKIEKILNENISYDASAVISNEEFLELKNNIHALQSLNSIITEDPSNTSESKLIKVNEYLQNINNLLDKTQTLCTTVKECQHNLIKQASEVINYM